MRLGLGVYADEPSGLAVATLDTALALTAQGVDVTLFALAEANLPARAEPLAERTVRLRPVARPLRGRVLGTGLFLAARLAASGRLGEALRRHPVDAIHVFSPGMAALLPTGPRVSVQAWFHPPRLTARLRTMLPFTARRAYYPAALAVQTQSHVSDIAGFRRADLVVTNTEVARKAMQARGFPAVCVPPPIEVATDPPVRESDRAFRIAFCGHPLAGRRKGLRYLLEALPRTEARSLRATLVGGLEPSLEAPIERARAAGVEVRLPGRVRREEYMRILAAETDLLVFPSLYEEWGYALFEALGEGVPALAFDLYPFSEIIDERTGILAPPGDAAALAEAIDRAAAGPLPGPATVREATRERFGGEAVAARLLEALR